MVILEIEEACRKDGKYDRVFRLANTFTQWLQEDHPEISSTRHDGYTKSLKKHVPSSIRVYVGYLRQYVEEWKNGILRKKISKNGSLRLIK